MSVSSVSVRFGVELEYEGFLTMTDDASSECLLLADNWTDKCFSRTCPIPVLEDGFCSVLSEILTRSWLSSPGRSDES